MKLRAQNHSCGIRDYNKRRLYLQIRRRRKCVLFEKCLVSHTVHCQREEELIVDGLIFIQLVTINGWLRRRGAVRSFDLGSNYIHRGMHDKRRDRRHTHSPFVHNSWVTCRMPASQPVSHPSCIAVVLAVAQMDFRPRRHHRRRRWHRFGS